MRRIFLSRYRLAWSRTPPSHGGNSGSNPDNGAFFRFKKNGFLPFLIFIFLVFSFLFIFLIYSYIPNDFPVVLKKDIFGFNILIKKIDLFALVLTPLTFLFINLFLKKLFLKRGEYFSDFSPLFSVLNFLISLFLFIITFQIYLLNF